MRRLRRVYGRRSAMLLAYMSLWDAAGQTAGKVATSFSDLASDCGVDARTARGHVDQLAEAGLVEIIDRDRQRGEVLLYISDHRELGMPRRVDADPQAALFETEPEQSPQPMVDALPLSVSPSSYDSPVAARDRGGLRAETPAGVCAQKPPARTTGGEKDFNSLVAQRLPPPLSPSPCDRPAVCDHGTIEVITESNNHAPIEHLGSHGPWRRGGSRAGASDGPTELDVANFERRQGAEQERLDREARAAKPIDQVLAASLIRFGDRLERASKLSEQKPRLVNLILTRVGDPELHRAVAGQFADNVLSDGLPFEVLEAVLDELDRAARAGKIRGSRGGWFVGAMKQRLRERGIARRTKRGPGNAPQKPRAP